MKDGNLQNILNILINKGKFAGKTLCVLFALTCICMSLTACSGNTAKTPSSAEDYINANYETVISELKEAGFTNITVVSIEDLGSKSTMADGTIEEVSIDGNSAFVAQSSYDKDVLIEVTYHTIKESSVPFSSDALSEEDYISLGKFFEDAGFTNVSVEETYDLDPDETDEDNKVEVIVDGSTDFKEGDKLPFDVDIAVINHRQFEKYSLVLHFECEENLIFSRYDLLVSLDDEEQGMIEHGKEIDYEFRVKEGSHTITFSKSDDSDVYGKLIFDVVSDIEGSYKLSCSSSSVSVTEIYTDQKIELPEGEVKIPASSDDCKSMQYTDLVNELENAGFTNVEVTPDYDSTKEDIVGRVKSISVEGVTEFKKAQVASADAEIQIIYHDLQENDPLKVKMEKNYSEYTGMPYEDVQHLFEELGFSDISCESKTTDDNMNENGVVSNVTVNGKNFYEGDILEKSASVVIEYWDVHEKKYSLDKDLIVFYIKQSEKYTSRYYVVFAEYDDNGTLINVYTFKDPINPRDMGDNFHAIGGFPSWFHEGATVHVKANFSGKYLSTIDFSVTSLNE